MCWCLCCFNSTDRKWFFKMAGTILCRVHELSTFSRMKLTDTKKNGYIIYRIEGAQWLSGRVLDLRLRGRVSEPNQRHCVVVLEQDTFILV